MKAIFDKNKQPYRVTSAQSSIPEHFKKQLLNSAKFDPLIKKNTNDKKRFSSREALNDWLAQEPQDFYFLAANQAPEELSGIIWLSRKNLPEKKQPFFAQAYPNHPQPSWTFAIRTYQEARGAGVAFPFMVECFQDFWQKYPDQAVWFTGYRHNKPAIHLYQKFGFEMFWKDEARATGVVFPKMLQSYA